MAYKLAYAPQVETYLSSLEPAQVLLAVYTELLLLAQDPQRGVSEPHLRGMWYSFTVNDGERDRTFAASYLFEADEGSVILTDVEETDPWRM